GVCNGTAIALSEGTKISILDARTGDPSKICQLEGSAVALVVQLAFSTFNDGLALGDMSGKVWFMNPADCKFTEVPVSTKQGSGVLKYFGHLLATTTNVQDANEPGNALILWDQQSGRTVLSQKPSLDNNLRLFDLFPDQSRLLLGKFDGR